MMHRLAVVAALVSLCGVAAQGQSTSSTKKAPPSKPKSAAASSAAKTAPAGPSTTDGVYTDEQASRGKDVYAGSCRSCHSPQSHTGATFTKWWRGKQLSDLFTFISTRMPKNDPGSLAPEDVADVMAYLLKMNAMPVGPNELYPDADSLKKFRIDTKKAGSTSTAKRTKP